MRQCSVSGIQAACCVINFVEALVFGLFVIVMLFDQFGAIFDCEKKTYYECLKGIFGEPLSYRWFLPLAMPQGVYVQFDEECKYVYGTNSDHYISTDNSCKTL